MVPILCMRVNTGATTVFGSIGPFRKGDRMAGVSMVSNYLQSDSGLYALSLVDGSGDLVPPASKDFSVAVAFSITTLPATNLAEFRGGRVLSNGESQNQIGDGLIPSLQFPIPQSFYMRLPIEFDTNGSYFSIGIQNPAGFDVVDIAFILDSQVFASR